jgi:hypothetical protein
MNEGSPGMRRAEPLVMDTLRGAGFAQALVWAVRRIESGGDPVETGIGTPFQTRKCHFEEYP